MSGAHEPADTPAMTAEMTIEELLTRWPATAAVIQALRLACIGCVMTPFCTVGEAAELHGLEPEVLLRRLRAATARTPGEETPDDPV